MNVLVAGGGRTGATVARTLAGAGHDVRLLEHRPEVLAHLHRELPTEMIYEGDGSDPRILELAGIGHTDVVVTTTPDDATNLSICYMARERFGVPRTIAAINNPRNAWLFDKTFHVDVAVNQADILAGLIQQQMSLGDMMTLLKLRQGSFSLVSEKLPAHAKAVGKAIQELPWPRNSTICAILRRGEVVIPRGGVRFEQDDEVLALADESSLPELAALFN
jgi:trk system potassium uptake protein TrkA